MRRKLLFPLLTAVLLASSADAADLQKLGVSAAGLNGPCSASLADGRSFLTGGGGNQALNTSQYFALNGTTVPVAPMMEARASHICVALRDNTVLVAGGIGATRRPTNSTEIFHLDSGQWTSAGSMLSERTGASAILLSDGRVLVAGGDVDGQPVNTLEIYDIARGRFEPVAGVLSAPRKGHALAVLEDGRVLIAGGTAPGGFVIDTTDIFEPSQGRVMPGPRMTAPRTSFTATRLSDGKVLVAGGHDGTGELASAEIFDPETVAFSATGSLRTAREGHLALVMPANGRVLIAAGNRDGHSVDEAEFFVPWRGVFEAAATATAGRGGSTITIGHLSRTGKLVATSLYASPTISLARRRGDSGETSVIIGAGWQSDEEVKVSIDGVERVVKADGNGRISKALADVAPPASGARPYVVARGAAAEAALRGVN